MKVTSKNLLNVCKLLFAIAKSDKNDEIFKEQNICGENCSAPVVVVVVVVVVVLNSTNAAFVQFHTLGGVRV